MEEYEKQMNLTVALMITTYANEMVMMEIDNIADVFCDDRYYRSGYGKKQYPKLKKMADEYSSCFNKIIDKEDNGWSWANFNEVYDDYIGDKVVAFKQAVRNVYYNSNIKNAKLLADVSVLEAISKLAVNVNDYFVYKFKYSIPDIKLLGNYRITKIRNFILNIMNDIALIKKDNYVDNFDINESRKVKDTYLDLEKSILNINLFLKAFEEFRKTYSKFCNKDKKEEKIPLP